MSKCVRNGESRAAEDQVAVNGECVSSVPVCTQGCGKGSALIRKSCAYDVDEGQVVWISTSSCAYPIKSSVGSHGICGIGEKLAMLTDGML